MNIGILTLHRAFNYGAYLQAYSLSRYLTSQGHKTRFIEVGGVSGYKRRMRTLISKSPSRLVFNFQKYLSFKDAWSHLPMGGQTSEHYDAVVVGSDELWSVNNVTFHSAPEFFGIGINANRIVAYAPSVGQSQPADLVAKDYVVQGLKRFTALSARDEATLNAVREIMGSAPPKVLDPTFLVDWGTTEQNPDDLEDTLLVYSYTFNADKRAAAKEFASRHGLRIISPGFHNSWCDDTRAITPLEFLEVMRTSRYVLTDTFHGTIFSILLRKNFATFSSGKAKICSLLEDLHLQSRDVRPDNPVQSILTAPPDYDSLDALVEPKRAFSRAYLDSALA